MNRVTWRYVRRLLPYMGRLPWAIWKGGETERRVVGEIEEIHRQWHRDDPRHQRGAPA